ncbi:p450 domain containing protein, partial [Asbolus verrucosus]
MEETQTMIITGTNSTINSECFVMLMLAMHPDIQQKVYEEISKIMGKSDRDIDVKDLDQLTYLECVIKETLRLFPIGMVIGRSIDRNLALGSTVLIPIMYMQRNSKIWPDPLKFNPDRFLPEEINKQEQYAFMSFSVPPRNCI